MTNDTEPVFDPKGRYLYFLSNRDFNLTFSACEFNYLYTNPTRVYVGLLAADGPALFLPTSDEERAKTAERPLTLPAQPRAAATRAGRQAARRRGAQQPTPRRGVRTGDPDSVRTGDRRLRQRKPRARQRPC